MKGTIVKCLEELVVTKFGQDKWDQSLDDAGFRRPSLILAIENVDDVQVMRLLQAVCKNLDLTFQQAVDAFGEHWVNVYSQEMYGHYYAHYSTARDFMLALDRIHFAMTQTIKDAKPPRFDYQWRDDKTLIIHYKSHRGLIDFAVGLTKAVGTFYKEDLRVTKLGTDRLQVVFP